MTEIMLTLEASVDNIDMDIRPIDYMKELFMSTPNLSKEMKDSRKVATVVMRQNVPVHHFRSTSYTPSMLTRRLVTSAPLDRCKFKVIHKFIKKFHNLRGTFSSTERKRKPD